MGHQLTFGIAVLDNSSWDRIVANVRDYEALGLDTVWIADHFALPWAPLTPWFECWSLLTGLATQTSRIRLGTLVSHLTYRNPAVLARQAMTVDHISGGRLDLGLGAGASSRDVTMTGTDQWQARERVGRFREAVEIIDHMLRQEVTSYHGRFYRVVDAAMSPSPVQQPRPPLTIAASGPRMVKIAARYADTWNTEGAFAELWQRNATPADVRRTIRERSELLSEEAAAIGRDPMSIRRSFLFGFGPAPEGQWTSTEDIEDAIGRYREIGITEFVLPEPASHQRNLLERVVQDIIPRLRQSSQMEATPAS